MRPQPLTFPQDTVLLRTARQRWAQEQDRACLWLCRDLIAELHSRVDQLQPAGEPDEMLKRIQAVVSGAVHLREQWMRHLSAVETLKGLASAEPDAQENACVRFHF